MKFLNFLQEHFDSQAYKNSSDHWELFNMPIQSASNFSLHSSYTKAIIFYYICRAQLRLDTDGLVEQNNFVTVSFCRGTVSSKKNLKWLRDPNIISIPV